jgi:hypothetical protein
MKSAGGDARVTACDLQQSRIEDWRDQNLLFFFRIS